MTETPIAPGSIRLHDRVVPSLPAGGYRFTTTLDVQRTAGGGLTAPPAYRTHVELGAPRFTLDASEVTAQHPPKDAVGAFGDRLPHVVLGRRTLPWERRLSDGTPWLALLVVRLGVEATLETGTLRAVVGDAVVTALGANEPVDANRQVVGLRARDLATFRALLPSRSDVALLSHVRQVNVADTALAGSDDDGWFSVVTANRLPLGGGGAPATWTACLVSLEARDDAWSTTSGTPPTLIVLASWPFVSSGSGGTFEHLVTHLDGAGFGAPAAGAPDVLRPDGSVPLAGTRRDGTALTVGYRPPLRGIAPAPLPSAADDLTGDAAFELGRLLAAADGRFIREVVGWHRSADEAARSASATASRDAVVRSYTARGPAPLVAATRRAVSDADRALADPQTHPAGPLGEALAGRLLARTGRAELWQAHEGGAAAARQADRAAQGEQS